MKVSVSLIENNPYRHIDKYPINREKVESLKVSIEQTGFWDNILLRSGGGKYQIAYGHHRLIAIRELGIESIDVPVKALDDATMLRIMANENMDEWRTSPAVINETVLAAKEFIDGELAKYGTWETSDKNIRCLFNSATAFSEIKTRGAGRDTILAFLGGNWKQWMIQEALATLNAEREEKIDRHAVESFNSQRVAKSFREAVVLANVPIEEQKELADKINDAGLGTLRETPKAVREFIAKEKTALFEETHKPETKPTLDEYLDNAIEHAIQINTVLSTIVEHPDQITPEKLGRFVALIKRTVEIITDEIGGEHERIKINGYLGS